MSQNNIKVGLRNDLPKGFNPNSIDKRYIKENRLTLLGIWYVDKNNPIISNAEQIIKVIQELIIENPKINKVNAEKISNIMHLHEEEVKITFRVMHDFGLVGGYEMRPGESHPPRLSVPVRTPASRPT